MTGLVAAFALFAAAISARSAASVVPARIDAALLLDGAQAGAGLRAFLDGVTRRAPALAPGARLATAVGPDLLADPLAWGLARSGARAIVVAKGAFALTAPVRDAKTARASLEAWLREGGSVRPRPIAGRSASSSGEGRRMRVGLVASIAGSARLVTASGVDAPALAAALAQIGAKSTPTPPLSSDRELRPALARLSGPAALVVRGEGPLRAAVLDLAGSADGLVATGLLVAAGPLLSGNAPDPAACHDSALLCVRASLGLAGRDVFALAARAYLAEVLPSPDRDAAIRIAARAASTADRVLVRSDGADARLFSGYATPLPALRLWAASSPPVEGASLEANAARPSCIRSDATTTSFATPCTQAAPADLAAKEGEPALDAYLDFATVDAVLQKLTPLDVLQGGLAGALYATRLIAGGLLRRSGPLWLRGNAHPAGAEVELGWPLH